MALSQAEKQRRYRERHLGSDGEKHRIQCVVSIRPKLKLKRLAHYYACNLTSLIEKLAADAEDTIICQIASLRYWNLLRRESDSATLHFASGGPL